MLRNNSLGIHIQKQKITYVKLHQNKVIDFGDKPMAELAKTLKKCRGKTAVPFHQTLSKTITVNACLNEKDIEILLEKHQKKYFPTVEDKLVFDFKTLSVVNRNQTLQVIAAFADSIQNRITVLKNICSKIISIEPDSDAVLRVLLYAAAPTFKQNETALLIAGGQEIQLIVFNAIGTLSVKHLSADKDDSATMITPIQKQFACKTVYLMTTAKTRETIKQKISAPIIDIFPFKDFPALENAATEQNGLSYLIALGLALKERNLFNFLPWRRLQKRKQFKLFGFILFVVFMINVFMIMPFYGYFSYQLIQQRKQNAVLKSHLRHLEEKQMPYKKLRTAFLNFMQACARNNLDKLFRKKF